MTTDELYAFLDSQIHGVLGTAGLSGAPHMVNVGFVVVEGQVVFTSFAKAQKIKNIERSPLVSFLVETTTPYNDVKGVLLTGHAHISRERDRVLQTALELSAKSTRLTGSEGRPEMDFERHAAKRVLVRIEPARLVSWDHGKLAGVY